MTAFALALTGGAAELPTLRHTVADLSANVEIIVDRWGVPHVYSDSTYDVYFGQGFNAARDRLWQIDLWRKRGLGRLAQDFGPAYLEQDQAARLLLFRGEMRSEWLAYSSDAKRIVERFVAGINAYVRLTQEQPGLLPPEFGLLNYRPSLWEPDDIVRIRGHGLASNVLAEVTRAHTVATAGLAGDAFRRQLQPEWRTTVPAGLDPKTIPANVLERYTLGREAVVFTAEKLRNRPRERTGDRDQPKEEARLTESNNFAVSAARSATGRALLANDPHRVQGVPSLRYFAHLSAPGLDVIGAGEPFLPGVSLGHNRTIAFGITIFAVDQEDLYVYETNPANRDQYRYRSGWESMTLMTETIPVKGKSPTEVVLKFTRHGPVIFEDAGHGRAFALRAAWLQPGGAPYLSSLEYQRAADWDQFLAAMNRHATPPLNYLFADTSGNIGWAPSALAPVRPNWDGLMPVPGDGRYEWAGYRTADAFPRLFNPPAGWFGTSNEMNLPAGPHFAALKLSFEWADPSRGQRQPQIFGGTRTFGVQDLIAAQTDVTSVMAQRATRLLASLPKPADPALASALETLRGWDHRVTRESAGAAIYNVWFHAHLRPAVLKKVVPASALKFFERGSAQNVLELLERPDRRLGSPPPNERDALIVAALGAAVTELTRRLGPDQSQWQWGRLHHARFEHPLAALASAEEQTRWNVGPIAKAGDGETLGVSGYRLEDYRLVHGASARFVTEVGDWSNAWATNSPGQSGDPRSPHYRDLFEDWAHDRYFPLLYERAAVEQQAELRIVLSPPAR